MNKIKIFEDVQFETICPYCHGTGGPEHRDDPYRCKNCSGAGYVPTEFGEKVLALMRHNFKPMLQDVQDE